MDQTPTLIPTEISPIVIDRPYLLVMTIPCFVDGDGRRFVEPLWHKDLVLHMPHIRHLILAAPARAISGPPPAGTLEVEPEQLAGHRLEYVDLPPSETGPAALRTLSKAWPALWNAVGRAEIVHGNVGGWPISYSWFAVPMARLRGKFILMNMESGSWRLSLRRPWKPVEFVRSLIFEVMGRINSNLAHIYTCTQPGYLGVLMPWRRRRGHVLHATWIDPDAILATAVAEAGWDARLADPDRPLRVVFAANLYQSKGIVIFLEALERLGSRGFPIDATIYGSGPLEDRCREAVARLDGTPTRLTMAGTVAYGPPFFEALDRFDLLVVPSLSDEQPRNVYDAMARALPVIASDTPGLRACALDGQTARLVPQGDVEALAEALIRASEDRQALRDMGMAALEVARPATHQQMHERRTRLLCDALIASGRPA